jgi:hypothetical protein
VSVADAVEVLTRAVKEAASNPSCAFLLEAVKKLLANDVRDLEARALMTSWRSLGPMDPAVSSRGNPKPLKP